MPRSIAVINRNTRSLGYNTCGETGPGDYSGFRVWGLGFLIPSDSTDATCTDATSVGCSQVMGSLML